MKHISLLLLGIFTILTTPVRSDVRISFDFFHDSLSPHGEWAEVEGYGNVWHPRGVDEDWAPYTDGYWSYTDAGWTWVSYEEFGGITYHYGRWVQVNDYGWCWVPGYEWGPAWVSWRRNDDYVGWAPLPPEAHWRRETGFGVWVDTHFDIGPGYFRFCRVRDFGAPVIRNVCLPRARNITIIHETYNITNISYREDHGYAFNGGIDYDWIAPRCERRVPALKLVQNTTNIVINGNNNNVFLNTHRGNQLIVNAPPVAAANYNVPTRRPVVAKTFAKPAISRGWAGVDQVATRERLLVKMRDETKGMTPESAPARAVKASQLAVVPKVADPNDRTHSLLKAPGRRTAVAEPDAEKGKDVTRPNSNTEEKPERPAKPAVAVESAEEKPVRLPGGLRPNRDDAKDDKPERMVKPAVSVEPVEDKPVPRPAGLRPNRDDAKDDKPERSVVQPRREVTRPDAPSKPDAQPEPKPSRLIVPREDRGNDEAAAKPQAENAARDRSDEVAKRQKSIDEQRKRSEAAVENQRRQAAEIEKSHRAADAQRTAENSRRQAEEGQRRANAARQADAARERAANAQRSADAAQRAQANENAKRRASEAVRPQAPAPQPTQPRVMPQRPQPTQPRVVPVTPQTNPLVVPKKGKDKEKEK